MAEKIDVPAWFERALDPSTPTTEDQETMRTASTYVEDLGGEVIYPTIRMNKAGRLFKPKDPLKSAIKNGDYILVEGPAGEETAMKATELSKRMSAAVAKSREPVDRTDDLIKTQEDKMTSDTVSFNEGGLASQKDKADSAFSEMDDMLKKGISEEVKKQDGTVVSKTYKDPTYAAEDVLRMLRAGEINIEQAENFLSQQKEAGNYAEGGYEDGGLKDEGGTVDPVSGNDVPSGSTQSEVRDDIPAQLSEGEFVLPADVVRYIGLENLMELRNKAKQGLQQMEDMGQMGNSEEAIMDDTAEMDVDIDALIDEFDPNDPETLNFAQGGAVTTTGAPVTSSTQQTYAYQPRQNIYNPAGISTQAFNYQPQQSTVGYQAPNVYTPPTVPVVNPTRYRSMTSPAGSGVPEQRQYIGPNGEMRTFTFINGVPTEEIPAGFKVYKAEEAKPEVAAPTVEAPSTGGDGGGSAASAQEQQQQKEQYEGWVTTMNQLSELDPEFSKEWSKSPQNPKNKSEGFLGGLSDFVKMGGVVGMAKNAYDLNMSAQNAYQKVANQYGLDIGKYENSFSFFGLDKYNESSLVNDAVATKTAIDSIASGLKGAISKKTGKPFTEEELKSQVLGNIARSDIKLDANEDGKISAAEKKAVEDALFMDDELSDRELRDLLAEKPDPKTEAFAALFEEENDEQLTLDDTRTRARDPLEGSNVTRTEYDTAVRNIAAGTPGVSPSDVSVTSVSPRGEVNVDIDGDGISDRAVDANGNSRNFNIDRSNDDYDASGRQTTTGANKDIDEVGFDEGDTGDTGGGNESYCCTKMVEHGLWEQRKELAKMHNWHMKQPQWWRDGYDVWGKVLANTLLKNNSPFWTSVMQECYEYHINDKNLSFKSALGNVIMYSGVSLCGAMSYILGKHVNEF